jgi:hypothetical protein
VSFILYEKFSLFTSFRMFLIDHNQSETESHNPASLVDPASQVEDIIKNEYERIQKKNQKVNVERSLLLLKSKLLIFKHMFLRTQDYCLSPMVT